MFGKLFGRKQAVVEAMSDRKAALPDAAIAHARAADPACCYVEAPRAWIGGMR
ncbi:hypothetical protein [Novosphingobium sp. BL-52-GroH]|uniref:hypothetical protein n=1 Tax=Novosphingobium sp. BL-52-GroH TaxID=3349877 RepID=UPI00384E871A